MKLSFEMASVKKSIFFSERLQQAIGPSGGFGAPVFGGESGLTKRVNILGDRFQAIIENVDIDSLLSTEQLHRVGLLIGGTWQHPTERLRELDQILRGSPRFVESDGELILHASRLTFEERIALVERIERSNAILKFVKQMLRHASAGTMPSQDNCETATKILSEEGFTEKAAPIAFRVFRLLAMGTMPAQSMCDDALLELGGD